MYVGFILQAMGTDFYPRLVRAANNNPQCNRLVNEQAHVSLLLAGPGVIATLTFAPLVIALFYTAKFAEAVEILRWICLGIALRVITWPMGFIIVAKNNQPIYRQRTGMDRCQRGSHVAMCGIVRTERRRDRFLCIVCLSRTDDLPNRSTPQRVSLVGRERENRSPLRFLDCDGLLRILRNATPPSDGRGTLVMILSGFYSIRVLVKLVSLEAIPRPMGGCLCFSASQPRAQSMKG